MSEKTNIVLIGMPGAGKSTLGVVLAKVLGYDFLDCDLLIQAEENATLQQLIDARGVDGFLDTENRILAGIECERTIVSTGGSAVYSDEAMRRLSDIGTIVYLRVPLEELDRRLGDLNERGVVLRDGIGTDLTKLFQERAPLYERYADITVDVDGLTISEAVEELKRVLCFAD